MSRRTTTTSESSIDFRELSDRIVEAAKNGGKDGFVIKMGRKTGNTSYDPLSPDGKQQTEEIVYDQPQKFYKHSISTSDYKRYLEARKQLAIEKDEDKRTDLTLRLYEYLALKFLGMTHEEFINADFDDVVVASLACDALFGSGTGTNMTTVTQQKQEPQEIGVERRRPVGQLDTVFQEPKRTYYKLPDEE